MRKKLLIGLTLISILLIGGCHAPNKGKAKNGAVSVGDYKNLQIASVEKREVTDDNVATEISYHYRKEDGKYNDDWVKKQKIDDVFTVDEYEAYIKEQLQQYQEFQYETSLNDAVWSALKSECSWNKKPEKEIQKYFEKMKQGNTDSSLDKMYMEEAEDEIMHREVISLIAKKEDIDVTKTELLDQKEFLIHNYGFTEEELKNSFTDEDIEYEALLKKVNHFLAKKDQ